METPVAAPSGTSRCWHCTNLDLKKPARIVVIALGALIAIAGLFVMMNAVCVGAFGCQWSPFVPAYCGKIGAVWSSFMGISAFVAGVAFACGANKI